ncbi:response regulator, partial [Massilia arenosa]
MLHPSHKRLPSIRSKTAKLVLACLVPAVLGFGALTYEVFLLRRTELQAAALRAVYTLDQAVDAHLTLAHATLRSLATAPGLAGMPPRPDAIMAHARASLAADGALAAVLLVGADGHTLADTRGAASGALPPEVLAAAAARGGPAELPLLRDTRGQPWIGVALPLQDAAGTLLVGLIDMPRVATLTDRQLLEPGWSMAIIDSRAKVIDRRPGHAHWTGTLARDEIVRDAQRADSGTVAVLSLDRTPVYSTWRRVARHPDWIVLTSYPRATVRELLAGSLRGLTITIAIALGAGLLLAWRLGGRIARSVHALTGPARALGTGAPVAVPPMHVRETAEVAQLLASVDAELLGYRTNLEQLVTTRTEELARSTAYLAAVFAHAPFGLCVLDVDLRFVMVNDYLAVLSGIAPADHVGRSHADVFGPAGQQYEEFFRQVLLTREPLLDVELNVTLPALPDSARHLKASYYPVLANGRVEGVAAMIRDVTAERLQAQRIRDQEEQFRALYERSGDAHMLVTLSAGFVGGNQAAAGIYGFATVDELLATSPAALSPPWQPDGQRSEDAIALHLKQALDEDTARFEWRHRRVDGTEFDADVRLTSVNIGGSGVMLSTVRDITERKEAEAALRAASFQLEQSESMLRMSEARLQHLNEQLMIALDQAHAASDAKSRFVANMSHEIRTPMNAVMGLARLLEEAPLEPRERAYAGKIRRATQSLLGILQDILDFSRIDAGELRLEQVRFILCDVLDTVSTMLAGPAWEKGIEPVFDVAPDVPLELVGDPLRLQQILLNLFSNGIKFTEHGEVVLAVRLLGRDADSVDLEFAVRDTGIGIAPDRHEAMFEAFSQGDTSSSRKYGGAGLGLPISRRLARLMGGELTLSSELERGSEFRLRVRLGRPTDAASLALPGHVRATGLRVLIADDNPHAARGLADVCRYFGWQADIVAGGRAALERLRTGPAPDLAFIDSAMPDLDGLSLVAWALQDGIPLPPLAMLVPEHERDRLLELADGLPIRTTVAKPTTREEVVRAIIALRGGPPAPAALRISTPLTGKLGGRRVLLVEDNEINQEVATFILQHAGAAVEVAANGRIAVALLQDDPQRYDVVLMDIQMPVMNGYEAARAIRTMGLAELPLVAMTANVLDSDIDEARAAGMEHMVAKPIDVDELVATIVQVTATHAPRMGPDPATPVGAPPFPVALPGIDCAAALARFHGNAAAFAALLRRFEASS